MWKTVNEEKRFQELYFHAKQCEGRADVISSVNECLDGIDFKFHCTVTEKAGAKALEGWFSEN